MTAPKEIKQLVAKALGLGDASSWFEPLYEAASGNADQVPWARLTAHPELIDFLETQKIEGQGRSALVVGCGLGDDAEELSRRGFKVTAFDISPTAIQWCQQRFPDSEVSYHVADLFKPPKAWHNAFDFVVEIHTIQALPLKMRPQTIKQLSRLIAVPGEIFIICRGRADTETNPDGPPWPLSPTELKEFENCGLQKVPCSKKTDTKTVDTEYHQILYRKND